MVWGIRRFGAVVRAQGLSPQTLFPHAEFVVSG